MKRFALLFASFLILASLSLGQLKENDWKTLKLSGRVKSLKIEETHRYKKDGAFTPWAKSFSHYYIFDAKGFKTEYSSYQADTLNYKATYVFKPSGMTLEESYLNKEGKETSKTIYKLNEKGKTIEETRYKTSDGGVMVRYIYAYDPTGNLIERIGYKPDGSRSSISTWKYDSKGNAIERNDGYFRHTFVYNDKGMKTEEIMYKSDGSVQLKWLYKYDDKGNKIQEQKYNGKGELRDQNTWRYEFDKKGNWIKRIQSGQSGDEFFIEERTIEYF